MIKVDDDYETVMYEQPLHPHVYENQLELLLDYYTRPRSNYIPIEQKVNEATILHEPEKKQVPCSSSNHMYQNVPKNTKRKNLEFSISLRKPKT